MEIKNTEVNGIKHSIIRSGYPKNSGIILDGLHDEPVSQQELKRADRLAKAPAGSGHDCFLKGITVHYDITCDHVFLIQKMRYHFWDIVSSQSKMHCLLDFNISSMCSAYVDNGILDRYYTLLSNYKEDPTELNYRILLANTPMGLELTMACVTNYLQLKSMYAQRNNHKYWQWQTYCEWIEGLPYSSLITGEKND